jgi:hypothetical protein
VGRGSWELVANNMAAARPGQDRAGQGRADIPRAPFAAWSAIFTSGVWRWQTCNGGFCVMQRVGKAGRARRPAGCLLARSCRFGGW